MGEYIGDGSINVLYWNIHPIILLRSESRKVKEVTISAEKAFQPAIT